MIIIIHFSKFESVDLHFNNIHYLHNVLSLSNFENTLKLNTNPKSIMYCIICIVEKGIEKSKKREKKHKEKNEAYKRSLQKIAALKNQSKV